MSLLVSNRGGTAVVSDDLFGRTLFPSGDRRTSSDAEYRIIDDHCYRRWSFDWFDRAIATAAEVIAEESQSVGTPIATECPVVVRMTRDLLSPDRIVQSIGSTGLHVKSVIFDRLDEARDVLNATVEQIADAAGLSRSTLFAWANCSTRPRPSSRQQLDRLFAVTGAAITVFGRTGAREWFAARGPARGARLLSGEFDGVSHELELLVARPSRLQRPARKSRDEEPTLKDGSS